jgi:AcrR family transcriptional regulator
MQKAASEMSDEEKYEHNALGQRVDALLRRHDAPASGESDVPVLTEVVDDVPAPRPAAMNAAALEALARELERAVLERLGPEVDRVIEEKLTRTLSGVLGQSVEGMRVELSQSVAQMVREAVAASVASTLAQPDPRGKPE